MIAQVTVADVAAILTVPLVLQPGRAGNAFGGGLLISACALTIFFVARSLRPRPWVNRLRKRSQRRGWALDLRFALIVVHAVAAPATRQPVSAGLIATAQLGVPAAVVQIGLHEHVISPGLGAAVTLAALATLGLSALGTDLLGRQARAVANAAKRAAPPAARQVAATRSSRSTYWPR